jgi:hypothetical protein
MLLHLLPVMVPTFAVFATEQGEPEFRPVVALGMMELGTEEKPKRVAAGFCVGDHIEPADFKPNFVGFSGDESPAPWRDRCQVKREEVRRKEDALKRSKIVVPAAAGLALHG